MRGSGTKNSGTFAVSTPGPKSIELTRLFDAPRALVYEAMSKPEHVQRWWGNLGEGYSVPICEIDLRVGGKWRFVNKHPQGEAEFYGEYLELDPPGRMVFTEIYAPFPDSPSVVTAQLIEEGGKTRLRAMVEYASPEVRDMVLGSGMSQGAGLSYDRLEDLLGELAATC